MTQLVETTAYALVPTLIAFAVIYGIAKSRVKRLKSTAAYTFVAMWVATSVLVVFFPDINMLIAPFLIGGVVVYLAAQGGEESVSEVERDAEVVGPSGNSAKSLAIPIGVVVVGFAGFVLSQNLNGERSPAPSEVPPVAEEAGPDWSRQYLGAGGISAEFPGPLVLMDIDRSQMAGVAPLEIEPYQFSSSAPEFSAGGARVVYAENVVLSPQGAAEGSVTSLRSLEGVTDVQFTSEPRAFGDLEGVAYAGTMTRDGKLARFEGAAIADPPVMYTLVALGLANDAETDEWRARVMNSISVDPGI